LSFWSRIDRRRNVTSEKKIVANRENALKSTGPRTPEGKAAASRNALRHGILSQQILLRGEDGEALRELDEGLRIELQPVGNLENLLIDRIIAAVWRLRRLGRVEAGIFAWEHREELAERAEQEARSYEDRKADAFFGPEIEIIDEEKHAEAMSRAWRIRNAQEDEAVTLGRTFVRDAERANAFSKLSRYETAIERQLTRALHELQRLQLARSGGDVPAPHAVDVDVSGLSEGDR
jgi:hypothetical protein